MSAASENADINRNRRQRELFQYLLIFNNHWTRLFSFCMLGNFACFFVVCWFFFQNLIFWNNISVKRLGSKPGPTIWLAWFGSYSKTCVKGPLSKKNKNWFSRLIIAKCRSKVLQNAPRKILTKSMEVWHVGQGYRVKVSACWVSQGQLLCKVSSVQRNTLSYFTWRCDVEFWQSMELEM